MKELIDKLNKYFLSPYKRRSLEQRNKSKYLLYVNIISTSFLVVFFVIHLFIKEGYFIVLGQLFGISLLAFSFYFLRIKKIKIAGNFTSFSLIAFCFFSFIINDYYLESIPYQRIYESLAFILVGLFLLSLFAISRNQIILFSALALIILLVDFSVIFSKLMVFPSLTMWISMLLCLIIFILSNYLAVLVLNKSKELIIIAERESLKSKLKYKNLFKNIDDGFLYSKLIFNNEGKAIDAVFSEANSIFEKLCGYQKVDIIGKKLSKIYPEVKAYFDNWETLISKMNEGVHLKYTIYNKFNKDWAKVQAYSAEDGYFVLLVDNITDYIEKDKSLHEKHEKFNKIINNISEGVIVFDDNKIIETNTIIENLLGYDKDELLGKSIVDLFDKNCMDLFDKNKNIGDQISIKAMLNTKDGLPISVNISGYMLSIEEKSICLAIIR
ncbi:MAG: PAS domain S-box protein [Saprospiraceae bacterium]|nr:PAS domain S-box protein [Saprospiraceae bacterium]